MSDASPPPTPSSPSPISPSPISTDDVAKVAALACLSLTDDELHAFTGQLQSILEHARDVGELDLEGVPPTAHPYPLRNVVRDDRARPCLDRDEVLAEAPAAEEGMFRVPPVLGEAP